MVDQNGQANMQCALVTGGSRGIGRGIAHALADAGYDLTIVHHQDADNAERTVSEIGQRWGIRCSVIEADLREATAAEEVAREAIRMMGRIDVLVNNAGITKFGSIQELSAANIDDMWSLNLRTPLLLMREISQHMIGAGIRGSILNITSLRATRAYPRDSAYGGLKAALQRASEAAALDLAPYGIRVNCIAPGAIRVWEENEHLHRFGKKIPLGRMGLPDDIGRAAAWLVSENAAYATGITLRVDGGLMLPGMPEDGYSDWNPSAHTKK